MIPHFGMALDAELEELLLESEAHRLSPAGRREADLRAVEDAYRAQQQRTPQSESIVRMPPDDERAR